MRRSKLALVVLLAAACTIIPLGVSADVGAEYSQKGSGNVVIIIQSGDAEMIYFGLLYASRAIKNKWMDNVKVVLWGPAEKTISGLPPDSEQIKLLKEIQAFGGKDGKVWVCKACADRYGVAKKMEELGCEVFHTGEATSYLLKLGYRLWTW
jgi:hypothetical protein